MAVKGPAPLPYTLVAGADFRAMEYPPVAINASGQVVLCGGPIDTFIGVLDTGVQKPNTGQHATVIHGPAITKVRVGANVTAGQYLTVRSGYFQAGNKLQMTGTAVGSMMTSNLGSLDNLVGIAYETVSSGGIATARLFETYTSIRS